MTISVPAAAGMTGAGFLLTCAVVFVIAVCGMIYEKVTGKQAFRPREPRSDYSPFTESLLTGESVTAYTAPVTAVTPGGITVSQPACCGRGHRSPGLAVSHAAAVARRIATTGR